MWHRHEGRFQNHPGPAISHTSVESISDDSSSPATDDDDHPTRFIPSNRDYTLEQNNLKKSIPLDNGRHRLRPKADLGLLDRLPVETLQSTLKELDIRSLTDFRRVNQRATTLVDSMLEYQAVIQHSPDLLRATLAIEVGQLFTCGDLFRVLSTALCEQCQDFGGFVYLLTCKRVCFLCFADTTPYLPLLASEVRRKFGLTSSQVAHLPQMLSMPGTYTGSEKVRRKRTILYDRESVRRAAKRHYGSAEAVEEYVIDNHTKRLEAYEGRVSRWHQSAGASKPHRPPALEAVDGHETNPRRFMAIIHTPWLDPLTKLADWGFHCRGCEDECDHADYDSDDYDWGDDDYEEREDRPPNWRRKFSKYTFPGHLQRWGRIEHGRVWSELSEQEMDDSISEDSSDQSSVA